MRLIDADELNKVKFHELPYTHIVPADLSKLQTEAYERGWNDAIDAIMESADTIDAEPVVSCKDCKHFADDYVDTGFGPVPAFSCDVCEMYGVGLSLNHYCAYGEREDDATD